VDKLKPYDSSGFDEFEGFSQQEKDAIAAFRNIKIPDTDEDIDLIWKTNARIANALGWVHTAIASMESLRDEIEYYYEIQAARLSEVLHHQAKLTIDRANKIITAAAEDILKQLKDIKRKITILKGLKEGLEAKSFKAQLLENRLQSSWYHSHKTPETVSQNKNKRYFPDFREK